MIVKKIDKFIVPESDMLEAIQKFLNECDADAVAHLAEICFGGECSASGTEYIFRANLNYADAFGAVLDHWSVSKVRTENEIRECIKDIIALPGSIKCRLILFEENGIERKNVYDIAECDISDMKGKPYQHDTGLDSYAIEWADKIVALEAVMESTIKIKPKKK
jgi:hypothetical protein